jgi:glutamine amidotransferase
MSTIAIIDYGMGNLHSVSKAIEHVASDTQVVVSSDLNVIRDADRIVLPGVGAIRDCMAEIKRLGFDELVKEQVQQKPVLGICVGMQAMMQHSQENGGVDGFGLFEGEVEYFGEELYSGDQRLKVPHMGWNQVRQVPDHAMWKDIDDGERFYFVHSYYVSSDVSAAVGFTEYGKSIAAAVAKKNIFSVQFHPEKSQHAGLQLLKNFTEWDGVA